MSITEQIDLTKAIGFFEIDKQKISSLEKNKLLAKKIFFIYPFALLLTLTIQYVIYKLNIFQSPWYGMLNFVVLIILFGIPLINYSTFKTIRFDIENLLKKYNQATVNFQIFSEIQNIKDENIKLVALENFQIKYLEFLKTT